MNNLSFLAVLESQVNFKKLEEKCDKIFGSWKWVANKGNYGHTSSIIIGWNSSLFDVNLIDHNDQVIHCKVRFPLNNKYVFCSIVYAANKYINRRALWSSIMRHKDFVRDDAWVIGGDFNVTLNLNESTAGSSRYTKGMMEFLDCINYLEIQDINSNGLNFTWNQKPQGSHGILKKLDRVMGNSRLLEVFPSIFASFLLYRLSDHSPVIIKIPLRAKFVVLPFKFPNVLTLSPELKLLVERHWNIEVQGVKMFRLTQKLKNFKKPICKLLKVQGHFSENVDHYRKELEAVQSDLDLDPFNSHLRDLEAIFLGELKKAYDKEERFLKQKAKIHSLKEGDSNSKFFHRIVKGKAHKNKIEAVMNRQGKWLEGEAVYKEFIDYFLDFLGKEEPCEEIMLPDSLFIKNLTLLMLLRWSRLCQMKKLKTTLFDINDDKAYGPDGYSAKFFKSMWSIIGEDFCLAVKEFFANGKILKEVNATVIALVPKVDSPGKVNVKRKIIDTLHFVEGKLPMRIGDWRNKFLSYVGRLQLLSSVLYSLPVYWASCLLIPAAIIKENEKLMKNFLWDCDESKKGRAKIAWSSVCKPVECGGLSLRNLRAWNKAILSKRIWMILSNCDSLWVKWININILKGRSFWDVEEKQDLSWSWRNLIRLRPNFRNHFYSKVGNGANTFMWYDDWHQLGAFDHVLSPREIASAGFSITDKVKDVIADNLWFWPSVWLSLIPQLNEFQLPVLDPLVADKVLWRKRDGKVVDFDIQQVWIDLSNSGQQVPWVQLVWFKQRIPRNSFILWLAIQERLMTQDRMRFWDKNKNLKCSLCNNQFDSHSHLFFECPYSSVVWKAVKDKVELRSDSHGWKEIIEELQGLFKGKSIKVFIMRIAFAASVYYIWREKFHTLQKRQE
uniref:Reverse transcriptase zinc-binding domain-containing protein n=1 Tax=Lactuca sativa TaxID=4236 RepID=A0A9R1UYN4_LACSA|nr:hypothetical protein LSAT_V11C700342460 [Lactuca sativa]